MDELISRQALLDKFEPWLKVKDYNDGELNMLKVCGFGNVAEEQEEDEVTE